MAILLGLMVAAGFGSGDFLGGLASRRARTLSVVATAQLTALIGAVIVALSVGGPISWRAVGLGLGAGVLNVAALGCLYQGLAIGRISQVAPLAAVIGATLPVGWALATGERPGVLTLVGAGLAVVAAALVSVERQERRTESGGRALLLALGAGAGFGVSFILFADSSHHSGFWPVLSARLAAVVAVWAIVMVTRAPRTIPRPPRTLAFAAGVLDVGATTLLLVAVRTGLVAVVAPVAALAPGFTVLHARWHLHERPSALQLGGLGVALVGLVLIAL